MDGAQLALLPVAAEPANTTLPANLDVEHARLPANYEAAKTALAACSRIDECQDWADKMAALASYARQLNDEILLAHCRRIQARAIRRASEVLQEIPGAANQHEAAERADKGELTRTRAAQDAGLTVHQQRTVMRVGAVPTEQFETLVESDKPPTVTTLADLGRQQRQRPQVVDAHLAGRDPDDFQKATRLWGAFRHFVEAANEIDLPAAVRGLSAREGAEVSAGIIEIRDWLRRVEQAIGDCGAV